MTDETETDATETAIATAGEGAQGAIEAQPDPFLEAVGARVRGLRTAHRLSRRALAERAGLSQRFIAQLEGGYGNISVRRLKTLVDALDGDLAEVVAGIGRRRRTRTPPALPTGSRALRSRSRAVSSSCSTRAARTLATKPRRAG